jgi:hypothetical protein
MNEELSRIKDLTAFSQGGGVSRNS